VISETVLPVYYYIQNSDAVIALGLGYAAYLFYFINKLMVSSFPVGATKKTYSRFPYTNTSALLTLQMQRTKLTRVRLAARTKALQTVVKAAVRSTNKSLRLGIRLVSFLNFAVALLQKITKRGAHLTNFSRQRNFSDDVRVSKSTRKFYNTVAASGVSCRRLRAIALPISRLRVHKAYTTMPRLLRLKSRARLCGRHRLSLGYLNKY